MNRFGYWAISNSASGGCGSHFFKMAGSGYCYDAYLPYWRGMQVDGGILFTNKGPGMVKECKKNQNCLFRGQYLAIKVT